MPLGDIFEHLPRIVPSSEITVEEEHVYEVHEYDDGSTFEKEKYVLDKAPVNAVRSVSAVVDGSRRVLTDGVDYVVLDDDNDGGDDTIDFSIGGDTPDDNSTIIVRYEAVPLIARYIKSHEDTTDTFDGDVSDVIDSHYINHAMGEDLDRIGSIFGELGRRRGRSDDEYRTLLRSIVQSFKGRGTVPGLKFAVAAGVGVPPENVRIDEDFTEVGYEIRIEDVDTQFLTSVVNDMAELADPSGVELLSTPIIILDGEDIIIEETDTSVVSDVSGLGSGTLTLDGNSQLQ